MNSFIKLFIILIIFNLNYINGSSVQFNNDIAASCTSSNPCDLSSASVWVNNQLPVNGDTVEIDLSNLTSSSQVYLVANAFHIELNQFTLSGVTNPNQISLVISNSNLTVSSSFYTSGSNLTFIADKSNTVTNIDTFTINNSILNINGSSNLFINTFNGNFGTFNVYDYSTITISGKAYVGVIFNHIGDGLISFNGPTTILSPFVSLSYISFNSTTLIKFNSIFNYTFVGDQVVISGCMVTFASYQSLSQYSTIQLFNGASLFLTVIDDPLTINSIAVYNSSSLYVPSGLTFSNLDNQMEGSLIILDSKLTTTFTNVFQTKLQVTSYGNITMYLTTLGSLAMQKCSLLQIYGTAIIYSLHSDGTIDIYTFGKLSTVESSNVNITNVAGVLSIGANLNANAIYIDATGVVYGYEQIYGGVYSLSGTLTLSSNNSIVQFIDIQQQSNLVVDGSTQVVVLENLIVGTYSTIKFDNAPLNNDFSLIGVNGYPLIDNSTIISIHLDNGLEPKIGDQIKLISSPFLSRSNYSGIGAVQVVSALGIVAIESQVKNDGNGNLLLVFNKTSSPSSEPSKYKIAIAIGSAVGAIVLISIVVYVVKRRHHHRHHHHHHHSTHENSPLIH